MPDAENRRMRRYIFAARIVAIVFVALVLDWQFGGLKFTDVRLNFAAALVALCLPTALLVLLLSMPRRLSKTLALVAVVPLTLFCLLLLPVVCLFGGSLPERQRGVSVGRSQIVPYLTNGGAMTSFGMIVQQEIPVFPGIVWVKPLCEEYPADDVTIVVGRRHQIHCFFPAYDKRRPQTTTQTAWIF